MLFELLGFKYVGPIDGHDLHQLLKTFANVRENVDRPTVVHVITKKGKGYAQAEENATAYHGAAPFCISTGKFRKSSTEVPAYTQVFGETLCQLAEQDERIVAITAAMCSGTGLEPFAQRFPTRFYDVGIAEQHAVTFAAGLAAEGLRPVVAVYSTFLQRAYDQIFHDVCLQNLPVVFALDRAGLVGADGPTHHGVFDFAYLRHLPNMTIMAPKDEVELQHMLYTAVQHQRPIAIRYPRGIGTGIPLQSDWHPVGIGSAEILKDGTDIGILAIGNMVQPALEAAKNLEEDHGIAVSVVNARFVKPLNEALILEMAHTTGKIVTVEEHALQGGFGSAVLEMLQSHSMFQVQVRCLGLPDQYIEQGSQHLLRQRYSLDADGIQRTVLAMLRTVSDNT
jgi:1-deoxy-D-xylulose-5-phosphate synthase